MHERAVFEGASAGRLERLRALCLAYPEAHEAEQFGHSWFKAGKRAFCVVEPDGDGLRIDFSTSREDQAALCASGPFETTPYLHQHGWVSLHVDGEPPWDLVEDLVETAYRHVALKRMLRALDERGA